jgi:ATP-binding cassette, subfamily C (CFTR/MRP), member 1
MTDPVNSVDLATDHLMREVMTREFADKTVVAVMHRLEAALGYDRILVLEDGAIAAFGTPEEILQTVNLFQALRGIAGVE